MKTAMVATFAAPVLCGLLAALPTPSSAQTSTITVPFDGVDYVIDVYDAGSDTTYAVTFTDSGFESVYEFDHEGMVTAITAKKEEYSIIYRNNGNLKKVNLVAWRRQLGDASEGANNVDMGLDQTTLLGRGFVELAPAGSDTRGETKPFEKNSSPAGSRRLDECDDCVYMWDTLCDQGVETVCNLDGYGKPFLPNAETSIEGFCSNFAGMCDDNTAGDVCEDECGGDECLPPLTITLEHTGGSGVAEANVDLYVVQPGGQTAYFDNTETETGALYAEDNKVSYTMFEGLEEDDVTGDYVAFARWYTVGGVVSYNMTATAGSGYVLFFKQGEFSDCGSGSVFADDDLVAVGTIAMGPFSFSEYVDNECD